MRQSELQQNHGKLETPAEMTGAHLKKCSKCKELKPTSEFNRNRAMPGGLQRYCRKCQSEATMRWQARNKDKHNAAQMRWYYSNKGREWREENAEELKDYIAEWHENNPGKRTEYKRRWRGRKAGSDEHFSPEEFEELCDSLGGKCACCGDVADLEADHIVPLSEGGSDGIDNIQPLCRTCNAKKGTLTMDFRV